MKKNLIEYLTPLTAVALAGCAAVFSVYGLSKLFGGAGLAVMVMAGILEFSKLIAASIVHNYWKKFGVLLRFYLVTVVAVLIVITSIGIYGFLIDAYQATSDELGVIGSRIAAVEAKKTRFNDQMVDYRTERTQIIQSITELSVGLTSNRIQYVDSTGQLVTTQSGSTRRALIAQINEDKNQRDILSGKIESLADSVTALDIKILGIRSESTVAAEVGPLRYLSKLSGWEMDKIVNFFALLFVIVFDPLAVTLIIVSNKIFLKRKSSGSDLDKIEKKVDKIVEEMDAEEEPTTLMNNSLIEEIIEETKQELEEPEETIDDLVEQHITGAVKEAPKPKHYQHPDDRKHKGFTRTIRPE